MKTILAAMALAALATPAAAQNTPARIAVVDRHKALFESAPGKAATEKLKRAQEERMATALRLYSDIGNLNSEIEAGLSSLTEARLAEMKGQLAEKRTTFERYRQNADREMEEFRTRETQALESKMKPVIDGIGKEFGLAAIFDKFNPIYSSEAIDITDTVIKRFNDAEGPRPAAPR